MIREIEVSDLLEISKMEEEAFITPYSFNLLKESITANTFFGLIDIEEEIRGYLIVSRVLDEVSIDRVAVKEKFKRQKIATNLLKTMEETLIKQGSKTFYLEVRKSNAPAINLYKSLGYKEVYVRKNYYENLEDAIIMEKVNY